MHEGHPYRCHADLVESLADRVVDDDSWAVLGLGVVVGVLSAVAEIKRRVVRWRAGAHRVGVVPAFSQGNPRSNHEALAAASESKEKERSLVGLTQVVKLIRRCVTFEVSDRLEQSFAND